MYTVRFLFSFSELNKLAKSSLYFYLLLSLLTSRGIWMRTGKGWNMARRKASFVSLRMLCVPWRRMFSV